MIYCLYGTNKPELHEIPKLAEISNLIENGKDKGSYFVLPVIQTDRRMIREGFDTKTDVCCRGIEYA